MLCYVLQYSIYCAVITPCSTFQEADEITTEVCLPAGDGGRRELFSEQSRRTFSLKGKWKFRCRFWLIFNAWKLNNLSKITMKMFVYNFCIANLGFALPLPSTFFDRVDLWICIWLFCLMCVNTDTDKATLNILFVNIDILYSNRLGSVISIW